MTSQNSKEKLPRNKVAPWRRVEGGEKRKAGKKEEKEKKKNRYRTSQAAATSGAMDRHSRSSLKVGARRAAFCSPNKDIKEGEVPEREKRENVQETQPPPDNPPHCLS